MADPGMPGEASCDLCAGAGGAILFAHPLLRVVLVDDPLYAGFCRVVWNVHVQELTNLAPAHRSLCMQVVCRTEQALRDVFAPHKINLASLGNLTPHLHWHVIARFEADAHFPQPIWGQQQRTPDTAWLREQRALLPQLRAAIAAQCATLDQ